MSLEGELPAFGPADQALLGLLKVQNEGLRAALCTMARHGVAFRRHEPERAQAWIEMLSPHPMFKAGQFLFDLMEWEDFMLDGAPAALAGPQASLLIARLVALLGLAAAPVGAPDTDDIALPALEAGFHLYRDVVLGGLAFSLSGTGSVTAGESGTTVGVAGKLGSGRFTRPGEG